MAALRVAVVATAGFSPFHFSIPSMVFDKAMPEKEKFVVDYCAESAGPVESDTGIVMHVSNGLDILKMADIIVIPFWEHPSEKPSQLLLQALTEAWHRGAEIVGLCLGAYVLAYAGLLDNHRAATHWEFEKDFVSRFPSVHLDGNALYTSDERLITSAGTAAGIDCCLNIVREHYGSTLANRVARRMVTPPYREGGQAQFIEQTVPTTTRDTQINNLIDYLRRNLDKRHDIESLSGFVSMSRRSLTRHFVKATGMSPGDWLSAERLRRSQEILETTDHSIEIVAELSGYHSPVSFRQSFKTRFGVSPSEWRRNFRGPAEIK